MARTKKKVDRKNHTQDQIDILKQQNEFLKSQLMNTSLITELTKAMHTTTNLDSIIKTILLGIEEIAQFDRIILFDINKDLFNLTPKSWLGVKETDIEDLQIPLGFDGGEITDAIFLNRHLIIENPTPEEDVFCRILHSESYIVIPLVGRIVSQFMGTRAGEFSSSLDNKSVITDEKNKVAPISENERRKKVIASREFKTQGVFWMDRAENKLPITSDDITTLSLIINQAGIIIENLRMFNALEIANNNLQNAINQLKVVNQDLRTAQAKINNDLEHARTVQQGLLPQEIPNTSTLSIKATYIPAHTVGGDYYDAFEISPGIFGITVADVSGHGVASALIMSMVKVLLKTFANSEDGPQKTLEKINTIFQTEIETSNFVTVFYAILDTNLKKIHYTSAGHCPILFLNKKTKTCTQVKADGLFLGVFPDMMLNETCRSFKSGSQRLILYTDGLTEARNPNNEMFDLSRLEKISIETLDCSPQKTLNKILSCQKKFCGKNVRLDDDITLLVIDC